MSNETKEPTSFEKLVAEKVAAGLPRKDAEEVAKRQIAEDEAAAKAAKATEPKAKK